jgi:hypothetical protein
MLALIHLSPVPVADLSFGRETLTAITPKAPSAWRRFMDALLLALAAPSV